jgi:glycosyltransferase involved in cell wall biosynthesis
MFTTHSPHIICLLPWLTIGGADTLHLNLLTELHVRGWRITIITTLPNPHSWQPLFAPLCEAIIHLGDLPPPEQPPQLLQHLTQLQPGWLLISNCALGYHMLPVLREACPATTCVDLSHAIDPADPRGGYPAISMDHAAYLDIQITVSATLREWLITNGGNPERIHACLAGVDTQRWDASRYDRTVLRMAHGIPEDAFVGLLPARLEPVKRPYLALRLMGWLVQQLPNAHFLIAGDGSYTPFVRSYIRSKRLAEHIHLLGAVAAERMPAVYAISDALLLPSHMEGLSVAILEAMAMGLVPISVAAGGQAELVTAETGFLIPRSPNEEANYRAALLQVATNRSRLTAMGQAGRMRIQASFRRNHYGDRFEHLLHQAAALHQSSPQPIVSRNVIDLAHQTATKTAERDAAWYKPRPTKSNLRSHIRTAFWWAVESGAWWLVPLLERLRRQ